MTAQYEDGFTAICNELVYKTTFGPKTLLHINIIKSKNIFHDSSATSCHSESVVADPIFTILVNQDKLTESCEWRESCIFKSCHSL